MKSTKLLNRGKNTGLKRILKLTKLHKKGGKYAGSKRIVKSTKVLNKLIEGKMQV